MGDSVEMNPDLRSSGDTLEAENTTLDVSYDKREPKLKEHTTSTVEVTDKEMLEMIRACNLPEERKVHGQDRYAAENEWLAEKTAVFVNRIYGMYAEMSNNNLEWNSACDSVEENLGFPDGLQYRWKVHKDGKPIKVNAREYIKKAILRIEEVMMNPSIFPVKQNIPFPYTFGAEIAAIFKLLYRILSIMICNKALQSNVTFSTVQELLQEFMFFAWFWDILASGNEDKAMSVYLLPMRRLYNQAYKVFNYP